MQIQRVQKAIRLIGKVGGSQNLNLGDHVDLSISA